MINKPLFRKSQLLLSNYYEIQQVDFQINRLISLDLSEISRLKTKSTD